MTDDSENNPDEALTAAENKRWEWLSTLVGGLTALSLPCFIALHALGWVNLSAVQWRWYLLYFGGYAASVKFTLGRGEFGAIREMLRGN